MPSPALSLYHQLRALGLTASAAWFIAKQATPTSYTNTKNPVCTL